MMQAVYNPCTINLALPMRVNSQIASLATLTGLTLAACSSSGPKCSGSDTLATLQQLIDQRLTSILNATNSEASVEITPIGIVTTEQDARRAACKATLNVLMTRKADGVKGKQEIPFTYTAEQQDDGKILVTAYGL